MKVQTHSFTLKLGHRKAPLPWLYCAKCGLVRFRNEASQKAVNKSCPGTPD